MSEFNNENTFPSKLILFGEYTVLIGGLALAIPYPKFNSYWKSGNSFPHLDLAQHIINLESSFPQFTFNINSWENFIHDNYFYTNIPQGYGLGSSGALVAGIFDKFISFDNGFSSPDLTLLKKYLGAIESYFHGSSSGLDPLVCYINKPILINNCEVKVVEINLDILSIFTLFDSLHPRNNKKAIPMFLDFYAYNDEFRNGIDHLMMYNNIAISDILENNIEDLVRIVNEISLLQFTHMQQWIVPSMHNQWAESLKNSKDIMKLCGGGGGGFYFKFHLPQ